MKNHMNTSPSKEIQSCVETFINDINKLGY